MKTNEERARIIVETVEHSIHSLAAEQVQSLRDAIAAALAEVRREGRREGIEEAAKACDRPCTKGCACCCDCATQVRALATPAQEKQG